MTLAILPDVAMAALAVVMVGVLGLGIASSARRAGRGPSGRALAVTVSVGVALWLAVTAALASAGALSDWTARPPRWPLVPLVGFVAAVVLARTSRARALIAGTPRHWPIAAQTFRVVVELVLFAMHQGGSAPVQVTLAGRNFDIVAGLTAPLVAWLVARRRGGRTLVIAWNVLGLALLGTAVASIATSVPGPLHRDWLGEPFPAAATWPFIWLPAFLAPLAVFFHLVSLRRARPDAP